MATCPMCNADVDDQDGAMDKHTQEVHPDAASGGSGDAPPAQM